MKDVAPGIGTDLKPQPIVKTLFPLTSRPWIPFMCAFTDDSE